MTLTELNSTVPVWTTTEAKKILWEFIEHLDEEETLTVEKEGMIYNAILFVLRFKLERDEY